MINLLPPAAKESLIFAHHNTKIARLIVGFCIGLAGVVIVLGASLFYLQQEVNTYKTTNKDGETALKQQNEAATIAQVQDISNSLKLVVNVLSQEILFSKLLRQVGAQMPPNTVLQDLKLSNELDGALDLQVGAADYDSASQVQVNLVNSKDNLFDKADLIGVNCARTDNDDSNYPCRASLRAVFNKDNNFTLLDTSKKVGATR